MTDLSDDLVTVCRDRDRDRLRDLSGDGTRDRIGDEDRIFDDTVDNITVVDRQLSIDGDTATITVTLDVTIDDQTTQVDRVWEYEKVEGEWVLSAVPNCIFS